MSILFISALVFMKFLSFHLFVYFFLFLISVKVLVTLTTDVGRILSKLHQVQPNGYIKFGTAIRVAHVS